MKFFFATIILLLLSSDSFSQKKTFLRIFNIVGIKIAKGNFAGTTDSSIIISNGKKIKEIKYLQIGSIKTKHSFGHTVLVTSIAFGTTGAIGLLAAYGSSFATFQTGFGTASLRIQGAKGALIFAGLLGGGIMGSAAGSIAGACKRISSFHINGHFAEWQEARKELDKIIVPQTK